MKNGFILIILLGLLATAAWGAPSEPKVVLDSGGSTVLWTILEYDYGLAELTVTGPRKITSRQEVGRGESVKFTAVDDSGRPVDGIYRWNLTVRSYLDEGLLAEIAEARLADKEEFVCELQDAGILTDFAYSGYFYQIEGKVILPEEGDEEGRAPESGLDRGIEKGPEGAAQKQLITGNLSVHSSLCVGFDCASSESYGFDTIRLKENNLRIHFEDTSSTASFPSNDWRIIINDSANGGANKFSIQDVSNSRTPFTVEARAPSNSLYVDDGGRIGLGTSTPVANIHVKWGNTPTLRLEQDGTSGFSPQTFDVAANEANFFIRDATNGSTLPFRIRPGAPSNVLYIDPDGEIAIGHTNPETPLHLEGAGSVLRIETDDNSGQLHVLDTGGSGNSDMIRLENNGKVTIAMVNTGSNDRWDFSNDSNFNISKSGTGVNEFSLNDSGDLTIRGDLIAMGGDGSIDPGDTFPDYVFAPEYDLMSIEDLEAFVDTNHHLPNVPSAADISAAGAINMTELQLRLLEKVEELTLYTISQEKAMKGQEETIDAQAQLIRQLTERLEALEGQID